MNSEQIVYTVREFCEAAKISMTCLYQLWARGEGPPRAKLGDRTVIPKAKALAWLEKKAGEVA